MGSMISFCLSLVAGFQQISIRNEYTKLNQQLNQIEI